MAYSPGSNPDRQSRVAQLAQQQGQVAGLLPLLLSAGLKPLLNSDQPNPPLAPRRSLDLLTLADASEFWLLRDAMVAGVQATDLPRGPRRAIDLLTVADASEFWLLKDAMVAGVQWTDLPPRAAPRAGDYTHVQPTPLNLAGQDAMVTGQAAEDLAPRPASRARDYTIAASFPLELIGKDAMAAGVQSTALPPRAAPRGQDFLCSTPLNLLGRDAMVVGQQLSGNAPPAARRASQLADPGSNQTVSLTAAPAVIPYGLSTGLSEQPPRGPDRAHDYSITASFPLELIGKDQLFGAPGQVPAFDWSYQPPKPRYQQGTGEPFQDLTSTLLASVTVPGVQATSLPPTAAPRTRDYTWLQTLLPVLLGQDAMVAGVQLSGNAPPGARRAVDYSILASFPLELIGRDAMTAGDQLSDLPFPRGAARARDYTIASGYLLELIGQDARLAGEQWTDLAPRGPARARDYSLTASYALANTTPQRDLTYMLGEPRSGWHVQTPRSAWVNDEPSSTWRVRPPQE